MNSDKTYFSVLHPGKLSLKAFGLGEKMGKKKRVNKQLESYYVHPQDKIQKKITISQNFSPQS